MRPPRIPDWLLYLTVVIALTLGATLIKRPVDAPPPPPPMPAAAATLAVASSMDPTVVVNGPSGALPGAGTAFSVGDSGVWLTARHVVEGCGSIVIVTQPGAGVAARVRLDPRAETAVLFTRGGVAALPMAPEDELQRGLTVFHPGFPQGRPGEAASRLVGRERLYARGRDGGAEPVLAWAEIGRTLGLTPNLEGLSGAPALDSAGRVVGVTIAQAPRRDRIYTTTPASMRAALAAAGVQGVSGVGEPIGADDYGRVADDLRRDLRVAQVVCQPA